MDERAGRPLGKRRILLAVSMTAVAVLASACSEGPTRDDVAGSETSTRSAPAPETSRPTAPTTDEAPPGTVLTTAASDFGPMLFDERGQAIYLFEIETAGVPSCYAECAAAWPPVLTAGPPRGSGTVRADLLGVVPRSDGSTQVTYAGHPLYFYANEGPGEVLCHDVVLNGGRWLVITPDGSPGPV